MKITQLRNLTFNENSELRNSKILFKRKKKKNPSYYFNKYNAIYFNSLKQTKKHCRINVLRKALSAGDGLGMKVLVYYS